MLHTKPIIFLKPITTKIHPLLQFTASLRCGCLRVKRHKDHQMDQAIVNDRQWRTCAKVVKEVLKSPNQRIPLHSLEKRRKTMGLFFRAETFVNMNPGLFETFPRRVNHRSPRVPFVRPGERLRRYLEERDLIFERNEGLVVKKICKLLMLSKNKVLSCAKLVDVKREFGFPDDFLVNLVPRYPEYFRVTPGEVEGEAYLGLVKWNEEYGKSVIELRAEEEERKIGIRVRPGFDWKLPKWIKYKKLMIEWVRDWMELPYFSPYAEEGWKFDSASREAEKRMIAVFHELLSLSLHKRMTIDVIGKFFEDYKYSQAYRKAFTRHQGLFYVSLKGPTKTIYLREAYRGAELIDRGDPLLEIDEKFIEMVAEMKMEFSESRKLKRRMYDKEREERAREPEVDFFDSD